MANGGYQQLSMALLVTWQGWGTQVVARRRVFGVPEANRGDGAGPGGVLGVQVASEMVGS